VLLGEDGADEADDRVAVGEDADHVGAAADLAVEALVRVVGPDLPPDRFRERGEGEDLVPGGFEVGERARELVLERVQDAIELGVHGVGVRLIEHGPQQGLHPRP
jgi:hypothetical protein